MKICRYNDDRLGIVEGDEVIDVTAALDVIPVSGWPAPLGDALIANLDAVCERASDLMSAGERQSLSSVNLKARSPTPPR